MKMLAMAVALGGCAAGTVEGEPPMRDAGTCDADAAQALIGREASAELGAEVVRLTGAAALRWLQPGQVVTMEFRAGRVNVALDEANTVAAIRCG